MATMPDPSKKGQPGPYTTQQYEEFARIQFAEHALYTRIGILPEQPDPTLFRRVLDVRCGAGTWVVEAAQMYPTMSLVGIDIDRNFINAARDYVKALHLVNRVEFKVMDPLFLLEFPHNYFDLVNLYCNALFPHTWDWPKLLAEMLRVTCVGGIIRLIDAEVILESNSSAFTKLCEQKATACYRAGYLFTQDATGLTAHFPRLLKQSGCQHVQTKSFQFEVRGGTAEGETFRTGIANIIRKNIPTIRKWEYINSEDALFNQALEQMQQSDFYSIRNFHCAWGTKPSSKSRRPQQEH